MTAPLLGAIRSNVTVQWAPFELVAVTTGLACDPNVVDPIDSINFDTAVFRPRFVCIMFVWFTLIE